MDSMNPPLLADLFDNPLVLLAIFLVSAFSNWLAKRRQEKESRESGGRVEQDRSVGRQERSKDPQDLEEALRRLLGEDPRIDDRAPPVPRLPGRTDTRGGELSHSTQSNQTKDEPGGQSRERMIPTEGVAGSTRTMSRSQPSALMESPPVQAAVAKRGADRLPPANRIEASSGVLASSQEPLKQASRVGAPTPRRGARRPTTFQWRTIRRAREAFIGSLILGPPKSLER